MFFPYIYSVLISLRIAYIILPAHIILNDVVYVYSICYFCYLPVLYISNYIYLGNITLFIFTILLNFLKNNQLFKN